MSRTCSTVIIFFGVFLILFGMIAYTTLAPMAMQFVVEKALMNLAPGTKFYKSFTNPNKTGSKMHVYLFEMLNTRDFLQGSKPRLRELGPFVFNVEMHRFNFTFSDNGQKFTYYQKYVYHFDRDASVAGLDQQITTVNFPLNMILSNIDKMTSSGLLGIVQPMVTSFIKDTMKNDGEYIMERRTVGQILVGRQIDFIRRVQGYLNLAKSFGIRLGLDLEKMKKIGYFRTTNNSVIGPLTVRTGKRGFGAFFREYSHHHSDNSLLSLFDDKTETQDYSAQNLERHFLEAFSDRGNRYYEQGNYGRCNIRRGTDGTAFNPYTISEQRPLEMSTPFCRPMKLRFWNYSTPTTDEPELANYVFDSDTFNYGGDNWCYCADARAQRTTFEAQKRYREPRRRSSGGSSRRSQAPKAREREPRAVPAIDTRRCDGVYDFSQCQKNAGVYLSFPYFANSPGLASYIQGWTGSGRNTNTRKFKNYKSSASLEREGENSISTEREFEPQFSLHKRLGVPFRVRVQLQFSVKITPSMTNDRRRRSIYLPFLWFEQRFDMPDKIKKDIKMLDKASNGLELFPFVFSLLGLVLIILGLLNVLKPAKSKEFDKIGKTQKAGSPNQRLDYQETISRVKGAVNEKINAQKSKISLGKNRTTGSSSSLAQIIPRTESRDSEMDRHREYSLTQKKPRKACGYGNGASRQIKMGSAQDKLHGPSELTVNNLPPLV